MALCSLCCTCFLMVWKLNFRCSSLSVLAIHALIRATFFLLYGWILPYKWELQYCLSSDEEAPSKHFELKVSGSSFTGSWQCPLAFSASDSAPILCVGEGSPFEAGSFWPLGCFRFPFILLRLMFVQKSNWNKSFINNLCNMIF